MKRLSHAHKNYEWTPNDVHVVLQNSFIDELDEEVHKFF